MFDKSWKKWQFCFGFLASLDPNSMRLLCFAVRNQANQNPLQRTTTPAATATSTITTMTTIKLYSRIHLHIHIHMCIIWIKLYILCGFYNFSPAILQLLWPLRHGILRFIFNIFQLFFFFFSHCVACIICFFFSKNCEYTFSGFLIFLCCDRTHVLCLFHSHSLIVLFLFCIHCLDSLLDTMYMHNAHTYGIRLSLGEKSKCIIICIIRDVPFHSILSNAH